MIDLHTHSNISDGDYDPAQLIQKAAKQGLKAITLTDHDTINGLEKAKNAALELKIQFIPGIEININWKGRGNIPGMGKGGEFHLLGLGIHSPTPDFIKAIDELAQRREARNREILNRMNEFSIEATWDELISIASEKSHKDGKNDDRKDQDDKLIIRSLGRPHFASLLVKHKVVKNIEQAFKRYLGIGKPFYVPKEGMNFEEAISLIRASRGIPVLAHPKSLFIAWGQLPDFIKYLKDLGLMGIEAWHPTAKAGSCHRLETLGKTIGLYITEGSDFHGSIRPERKLGYSSKGRAINDAILEAIPELACSLVP